MKETILTGTVEGVLSRSEMKSIMAGTIYCNEGGEQVPCEGDSLTDCLDGCVEDHGSDCGGCAEF